MMTCILSNALNNPNISMVYHYFLSIFYQIFIKKILAICDLAFERQDKYTQSQHTSAHEKCFQCQITKKADQIELILKFLTKVNLKFRTKYLIH